MAEEDRRVIIRVRDNGPYKVQGPVTVTDAEGNVLMEADDLVLCRCGQSGTKPFCDGSHRECGFASVVRAPAER